jgi:Fuc2NAc and GlcNAc transferase
MFSGALAALIARYGASLHLIDVPNDRSSHQRPTPRGGGIGFVVATVLAAIVSALCGWLAWTECMAFAGSGTIVAAVGFADDRFGVSPRIRLLCHFAAIAAAFWLSSAALALPSWPVWFAAPLIVIGGVWAVNLFNFMDGIDGLVASQSALIGGGVWGICALVDHRDAGFLGAILAAGAAGFFCVNSPPARVFMGDVGSGFLGASLAVTAIIAAVRSGVSIWAFAILFGALFADSTVTLVRRVLDGHSSTQAHRTHLYQRLARAWVSHGRVAWVYGAVGLLWLLPLAVYAALRKEHAPLVFAIAVVPLSAAAVWLGAGRTREPHRDY